MNDRTTEGFSRGLADYPATFCIKESMPSAVRDCISFLIAVYLLSHAFNPDICPTVKATRDS